MAIDVLSRGERGYDDQRGAFNVLLDQEPAGIVLPSSAREVADAVAYAKAKGLRVAAQRTGHLAEPLGDLSGTLLVRTAELNAATVDAEAGSARVDAGALWSDLVPQASELGLAARHGSSPSVGIVGYTIGGGVGWYGRKHGLACNAVSAVEMVGADCQERRVEAASDPELFWALRGGGGDFGIVTGLEFDLLPVPEVYAGAFFFPIDRSAEVFHGWHEWIAGVPDEVTSLTRLMNFPPLPQVPEPLRGNSFAIVEAVVLAGADEASEFLAPLRGMKPLIDTFAVQPPAGLAGLHMDPTEPAPYAAGGMMLGDLPENAIDAFLAAVGPGSGSKLASVELRHVGGAMGRSGPDHGALDSLPGSFLMFGVGIIGDPATDKAPTVERLANLTTAMEEWNAGRYLNFSDEVEDIGVTFPPAAVARLRAAKETYDPENLFHANHPVDA
jgi:FAD/FMN-containing dehydrogenase